MHMSPGCLPPVQPPINEADRTHPLFPLYIRYRASMSAQLVEASRFADWLAGYNRELETTRYRAHPQFPVFLAWMKDNKGGARKCPAGMFPHNFNYWLAGGRW